MEKTGWKALAIVFICLFIVETLLLIWIWNVGTEFIENENECAVNICQDKDSYYYDSQNRMCYCYVNHEIVKQKFIG